MSKSSTAILIPARMASERLLGKPLADLGGVPMIVEVMRRGEETGLGAVLVAAGELEIVCAVENAGGTAVLTDPDLPSGSDRIAAALEKTDPEGAIEYVINLQGDLPTISPAAISACHKALIESGADIATLVAEIDDDSELADPNVVKALVHFDTGTTIALADDFMRILPGDWQGGHYHHIGIYAYRRAALARFVALPQSAREKARKLEQMRALDNGMKIAVSLVDTIPFGVDTPADLERARQVLAQRN
ncbi:MAG: 3-deoxy-manno-octulosonate cytidylyltransferase [Hyphomicrobiales bacterium]